MLRIRSLSVLLLVLLAACQSNPEQLHNTLFETYRQNAIQNLETRLAPSWDLSLPATAPDAGLAVHSVEELQRLALQVSPYVASILIDLGIHEAESVQRRLASNPQLAMSLMRPEDGGRWQFEVSLSLGLLDWLGRQRRLALADAEHQQWQIQAMQQLGAEFYELQNLWLDAQIAHNKASIFNDMLESSNVSAEFSRLLFEAGNISELDLLASQSVADQRQAQAQQAALEATQALLALKARLGLQPQQEIKLPEQLPQAIARTPLSDEQSGRLLSSAQQHFPALLLADARYQQSQAALALAVRQQQLRDAGVAIGTERESNGEREYGVGLSLALPVFDSGYTRLSRLQGEVLKSEQAQRQQAHTLQAEVATAVARFNTSIERLQLLEQTEMPRLREMMALGVREYNFMLRGTFELLSIADLILDARLRQLSSQQQYWQSLMQLEYLAGQPVSRLLTPQENS